MKSLVVVILSLLALVASAEIITLPSPDELLVDSKLVFVGRVQGVRGMGVTTTLNSRPQWQEVKFQWLLAQVEVIEGLKGVRNGETVNVATLHYDDHHGTTAISNPPESPEPQPGDLFLFCLAATPRTNVFAALTSPYRETDSIIALHRIRPPRSDASTVDFQAIGRSWDRRYASILNLCNHAGELLPEAVERARLDHAASLAATPTNKLIHLEWEAAITNGVCLDVPKVSGVVPNLGK